MFVYILLVAYGSGCESVVVASINVEEMERHVKNLFNRTRAPQDPDLSSVRSLRFELGEIKFPKPVFWWTSAGNLLNNFAEETELQSSGVGER